MFGARSDNGLVGIEVSGSTVWPRTVSRRVLLGGAACTALCGLAAPAIAKRRGAYRSLRLVNARTDEWVETVYWVEGTYLGDALTAFNHLMRDWRQDEATAMDPKLLDVLWETHQILDCDEPFQVISGYRTARTNALLRRRNRGVARNSYHMRGMAVDVTLRTRSVRQIARAAATLEAGGVGRYTRSHFVHFDTGPVRYWGR